MNSRRGILNKGAKITANVDRYETPSSRQVISGTKIDLANLAVVLIKERSIRTTESKARKLRPFTDRLVQLAIRGDYSSRLKVKALLRDSDAANTLIAEIAPRMVQDAGSHTQIRRVIGRKGRNTSIAIVALVLQDSEEPIIGSKPNLPEVQLRDSSSSSLEPSTRMTRATTNRRVLTTINRPINNVELRKIGSTLGIPVRSDSNPEIWTLGLGIINDDEENPALLRIVRSQHDAAGLDIEIAWQGAPPAVDTLAGIDDSIAKINRYIHDLPS